MQDAHAPDLVIDHLGDGARRDQLLQEGVGVDGGDDLAGGTIDVADITATGGPELLQVIGASLAFPGTNAFIGAHHGAEAPAHTTAVQAAIVSTQSRAAWPVMPLTRPVRNA